MDEWDDHEDRDRVTRKELLAMRRDFVSRAKLYTTVGTAAVLCLGALWAIVEARGASEATVRKAEIEAVGKELDIRQSAEEHRLDELSKTISEGLAELRTDVKTLLRR